MLRLYRKHLNKTARCFWSLQVSSEMNPIWPWGPNSYRACFSHPMAFNTKVTAKGTAGRENETPRSVPAATLPANHGERPVLTGMLCRLPPPAGCHAVSSGALRHSLQGTRTPNPQRLLWDTHAVAQSPDQHPGHPRAPAQGVSWQPEAAYAAH